MAKSIESYIKKSSALILLAITLLTATGISVIVLINQSNKHLVKEIYPKKNTLKDYTKVVSEFELLWNQSDKFFAPEGYNIRNKFKGITEVDFPNLNQKVFLTSEDYSELDPYFKSNKKIIYYGEELVRLSNKFLLLKSKTTSLKNQANYALSELKSLINQQDSYLKQEEIILRDELNTAFFIIAIVSIIISISCFFIVFKAIKIQQKTIVNPILELNKQIAGFSYGNYGEKIEVGGLEEFKNLSSALTQMSKELHANFKAMSKTVKRLVNTTEELQVSNEQLEEFTYIASHDLKTPVRGLKNLATFIKEDHSDKLDSDGLEMVDKMQLYAARINNLIDDLLIYSNASKAELKHQKVNLNDIIGKVSEYLEVDLNKSIILNSDNLPEIKGDRAKIASVFTNFFTNAIKYNESEIKEITIKYEQSKIYFSDNGIGIPEEQFDRVFEFFKRVHSDQKYEGTGAGMAIVKKILGRHNIGISIQSKVGIGTTFILDLTNCLKESEDILKKVLS